MVGRAGAAYIRHAGDGLEAVRDRTGYSPDLIVEASGHSPFVFEGMRILGVNGILAIVGASAGRRRIEVASDETALDMVLGNRTVFGCVNSNRTHFERSLKEIEAIETEWPGLLSSLVTRRLPLEEFADALSAEEPGGVKTLLEVTDR